MTKEEYEKSLKAIRCFNGEYQKLDNGEKAQLRRTVSPSRLAAFWICFNPAKKVYERLSVKRCEYIMQLFSMLEQQEIKEDVNPIGIGEWLSTNQDKIKLRRVEMLFTLDDKDELLDELLAMAAMVVREDKRRREIDYGKLYWQLRGFEKSEQRLKEQRLWAEAYFSQDIPIH